MHPNKMKCWFSTDDLHQYKNNTTKRQKFTSTATFSAVNNRLLNIVGFVQQF
jgi:hypothetical protein